MNMFDIKCVNIYAIKILTEHDSFVALLVGLFDNEPLHLSV